MSTIQENLPQNENQSSDVATNRDDEDSPLDSKIEINNKPEEESKRKLISMLKEYEWDKKDESQEKEANCPKDVESESGSNNVGDICRICHMGNFPPLRVNRTLWERRTQHNRQIDIQASSGSNFSYLGPLISACKCRGTVGLVHVECLERWLTESGHSRCELCGHKFSTKRVPRHSVYQSIGIWFKTVFATRQMMLDILYLAATTPLALFSIYVCALALKLIVKSGIYEVPWMVVAMLPTCSLTLIAYWGWLITLGRYITRFHSRRWQTFWRHNFIVRLVPENVNELRDVTRDSDDLPDNAEEMELDQWQEEDISIFLNVN